MAGKIDHVGWLTGDIAATAESLLALGWSVGEIVDDPIQRARILILSREGEADIELVEPFGDNRSLRKALENGGAGPYHICLCCDDLDAERERMISGGWAALSEPVPAIAFGGRRICHLWMREAGFVELLER